MGIAVGEGSFFKDEQGIFIKNIAPSGVAQNVSASDSLTVGRAGMTIAILLRMGGYEF